MEYRRKAPLTPEIEEWRKKSPLKIWLESKPELKRQRLAKLRDEFGVARVNVYFWIAGQSLPPVQRFVRICQMIGCTQRAYLEWFNDFPQPEETSLCGEVQSPASA